MKNLLEMLVRKPATAGVWFFTFLASTGIAYSGDAYIANINIGVVYYLENGDTVKATFRNDENFDVPNFSVSYTIWQEVTLDNWQLKYEWSTEGLTVEANSELEVASETTWKPMVQGRYQFCINSYSSSDIDLSNNTLYHDFIVGNFKSIKLRQINFINPYQIENSTTGMFTLKLPPRKEEAGISFINVIARKPQTTSSDWIVRNLPIAPFDDYHRLSHYFDLSLLDYKEGEDAESLEIAVQEDTLPLSIAFTPLSFVKFDVDYFDYNIPSDNESEEISNTSLPQEVSPPEHDSVEGYEYYYVGCKIPNIDLDSNIYKVTGEYAGDWNACGPAAAANSIQWLEETNGNIPSTGTSHREKMEEISRLMGRANKDGVTTEQLVKGKLAFIDKYKLPIHVKFQSWWQNEANIPSPDATYGHSAENRSDSVGKQKPPKWEFLKEEVKKGEDVEILFGWYNHGGQRKGGHWITVSGFFDSDSLKGIFFKDDGTQQDSAGTRETFIEWQIKDEWSRLAGFDGPNNYCWIESVVTESYDETVTFENPDGIMTPYADEIDFEIINNPARIEENVTLKFYLNRNITLSFDIITTDGRTIISTTPVNFDAGQHFYQVPGSGKLGRGNYLVVLKDRSQRFVKQLTRY
jgi:hypothetical protein